jgi:hypothetical protein
MSSQVGDKGQPQQLTSVTAGTWTTLFDGASSVWLNAALSSLSVQNTGANDIKVSFRLLSADVGGGEYDGDLLTDVKISGSARRGGILNNVPGSNPINFSHDMAPNVDGLQPGGHDSNSFGDFNGLTYTGRVDWKPFQMLPLLYTTKIMFKCDTATGFIATAIPSATPEMKVLTSSGGNGINS